MRHVDEYPSAPKVIGQFPTQLPAESSPGLCHEKIVPKKLTHHRCSSTNPNGLGGGSRDFQGAQSGFGDESFKNVQRNPWRVARAQLIDRRPIVFLGSVAPNSSNAIASSICLSDLAVQVFLGQFGLEELRYIAAFREFPSFQKPPDRPRAGIWIGKAPSYPRSVESRRASSCRYPRPAQFTAAKSEDLHPGVSFQILAHCRWRMARTLPLGILTLLQ